MTLEEIKKLSIKNAFDSTAPDQPVATLEEFLDTGKGNIGLFIELKGKMADEKMVDDVVAMVRERKMVDQVALLSLDYPLIQYIEKNYPEFLTGYLYFFSLGDIKKLEGDILVMEEGEATKKKIDAIHKEGKQAIVWMVNERVHQTLFVFGRGWGDRGGHRLSSSGKRGLPGGT